MRAAVLRGAHEVAVETIELAPPNAGEVRVRVAATGLCHTDLGPIEGVFPVPMPIVLGHEGAGVVTEVGPGVADLAPGDHVVLSAVQGCGHCFQCNLGAYSLCETSMPVLRTGMLFDKTSRLSKDGETIHHFLGQSSFAEEVVVPRNAAVKIRDDAPLDVACLLGCGVMTGAGAMLNRAVVRAGESVVILGVGGVGLSAVLAARTAGANPIIAVDRAEHALTLASELGATHVIDGSKEDVAAAVRAITARGADHAIDVVGAEGTIETCLQSVRPGGQVISVGVANPMVAATISISTFLSQKRITGSIGGSGNPHIDIPRYLDLFMAGRLPIDRLVTRRYGLEEINQAIDDLQAGRPGRGVVTFG